MREIKGAPQDRTRLEEAFANSETEQSCYMPSEDDRCSEHGTPIEYLHTHTNENQVVYIRTIHTPSFPI